ncbi:MAG: SDR family oxidoreductase [Steroidobacteraceae bacterium]
MPSVLITGANRGLGLEFARQYAADRWQVHATCRNPQEASELAALAGLSDPAAQGAATDRAGPRERKTADRRTVSILPLDVMDADSIERTASAVSEPIDVLINGAGITGAGHAGARMDYDAWEKVLRVNTLGPMRVSEAFAAHVARSDRKLIVTITSGLGSIADNTSGGWIAYRSSKAAVNMVMRSLAVELSGRGIVCVVVSPGWVQTDMGGPGAPLTPAESVTAMRRLIDRLQPGDGGTFFRYDGTEIPW